MRILDFILNALGRQKGRQSFGDLSIFDAYWKAIENMNKKELSELIRSNIEAFAPIQAIVNDVLSAPQIVAPTKDKQEEVYNKLVDNGFFKNVRSAFYDYLIYGDAYLEPVYTKGKRPKKVVWIPAKTIEKKVDVKGNIIGYEQTVDGKVVAKWKPNEIIHLSAFYYEAGRSSVDLTESGVSTFTPLSIATDDLRLLDAVKEYVRRYFESGGLPKAILRIDKQNMLPSAPEYEQLKAQLTDKLVKKRNGLLVMTDPVEVIPLQKSPDEMQYGDLYNLLSRLMCVVWDVPLSRVYGAQQRSDEYTMIPYFSRIRAVQDEWARVLSKRFVSSYGRGVSIKFTPAYARNQVRAITWVVPLYKMGLMSPREAREVMGLPPDFPEDISENPYFGAPKDLKPMKPEGTNEDERRARDNNVK